MPNDFVMSVRGVSNGQFGGTVGATRFLAVPDGADPAPGQAMSASTWYAQVLQAAAWSNAQGEARGDILFFVHGFNMASSDTIQRHRALRSGLAALGFKGVLVSFDWPSYDTALAYVADRQNAKDTASKLVTDGIAALSRRQTPDCTTNVHVLCHSMGAYVLREAFDSADDTQLKQSSWTVSQILLAAGDISAASMSAGNPSSASIFNHCVRLTNYSNRHDLALDISNVKRVGVAPRVGRVGLPDDAPAQAVDVDCTEYYALLDGDPKIAAADESGGLPDQPARSHSWYFGNAIFTRDLFNTIIGVEADAMPTRQKGGDGRLNLTR